MAVFLGATIGCAPRQISPYSSEIRFIGRIDRGDPRGPRLAWSATSMEVRFTGRSIALELLDLPKRPSPEGLTWPNRYQVALDHRPPVQAYVPASGRWVWSATDLPPGEHLLTVFKQTEALVGEGQLLAIQLEHGGRLLSPKPATARRIEFIGDSLTTGYGDEGSEPSCHFSQTTENVYRAFPALTARAFGAEFVVVAWSGKGLTRNYETPQPDDPAAEAARRGRFDALDRATVPELYERTLPSRSESRYDFRERRPDAVVITLGGNDFSAVDPGEATFVQTYRSFIQRIHRSYPATAILIAAPPLTDHWPPGVKSWTLAHKYLDRVLKELHDQGVYGFEFPARDPADFRGCDYHPTVAGQAKLAQAAIEALSRILQWDATSP